MHCASLSYPLSLVRLPTGSSRAADGEIEEAAVLENLDDSEKTDTVSFLLDLLGGKLMVLVFRSREKRRCSLSKRRLSLYGRFGAGTVADGRLSVEEDTSGFVRIWVSAERGDGSLQSPASVAGDEERDLMDFLKRVHRTGAIVMRRRYICKEREY